MVSQEQQRYPIIQGIDPKLWVLTRCASCSTHFGFVRFDSPVIGVKCPQCSTTFVYDSKAQQSNQNSNSNSNYSGSYNQKPPDSPYSGKREDGGAKDTSYYESLGVETTATPEEIKRGYYKMARLHHPDKHPNDPEADTRFKLISEAYQVLSDPQLRERYDKYGKESLAPSGGFAAPREFFASLFGGGRFKDFIGEEFMIAGVMDETITPEQRDKDLKDKVDKLAVKLEERLDTYVKGQIKFFEDDARAVVNELKGEINGIEILDAIGYIYEQEGKKALGGVFGFAANISGRAHTVGSSFSAIKSAIQLQNKQKEMDSIKDEDRKRQFEEQLMKDGMATMWKVGKLEVEATLRQVCITVLTPVAGQDPNLFKKRAEGLKFMGKIFQSAK